MLDNDAAQHIGTAPVNIDEEDADVGMYYSILPIRDTTVIERWKYRARRWTFYCMFALLIIIVLKFQFMVNDLGTWFWVIHLLWVDLDVTVTKNQNFVRFIHGGSFIGSFIIAAVGTLILVREPNFIHSRAGLRHRQEYQLWIIHSITNFVPPFLHALDLYHNLPSLRKRHDISAPCRKLPKDSAHSSPLRQSIRALWMFVSPVAIVIGWFFLKEDPEYDVIHDFPLAIYMPALIVIDILAGILLLFCLFTRTSKYPPLLEKS